MNINDYVKEAKEKNIALIDVRPKEMYDEGHIPGAVNIPLAEMDQADVKDGSYLYCVTGMHAGMAQEELAKRGIHAINIGGIENYTGKTERA